MERIKQAIENVRTKEQHGEGIQDQRDAENQNERRKNAQKNPNAKRNSMIKRVVAILLIFTAGGAWFRLDCLNEQEKGASEYINEGIQQARAEAKRRVLSESRFGFFIRTNLSNCQEAADKANKAYVNLVKEATPRKQDKNDIVQPIVIYPEPVLMAAKAECQRIYDAQLKSGQF